MGNVCHYAAVGKKCHSTLLRWGLSESHHPTAFGDNLSIGFLRQNDKKKLSITKMLMNWDMNTISI